MLVKSLKAKAKAGKAAAARPAAKPAARKAKVLKPEFTPEEVATFERQLQLHKQAESAWQRLSALPEGDDRWSAVEEDLLYKTEAHAHAERRWKYFAK